MLLIYETLLIWIFGLFWANNYFVVCDVRNIFMREHSSKCENVIQFESQSQIKQIGKWKNGCPKNRYIRAVWAENAQELFHLGKCCGTNEVLTEFSWEIRDIQIIRGGQVGVHQDWKIQCPLYSALTGFRLILDHRNTRVLSSVRCSLLKHQVFDRTQCAVLDFKRAPSHKHAPLLNQTWQHECPNGYGLVGLYVNNGEKEESQLVEKVEKGKCCRIYDPQMEPGWTSNFTKNFAGFAQYNVDIVFPDNVEPTQFEYNKKDQSVFLNGVIEDEDDIDEKDDLYRGVLVSPHFDAQKICLNLNISTGEDYRKYSLLNVTVKQSRAMRSVRNIKIKKGCRNYQVYISSLDLFQIVIVAEVLNTTLKINKITLDEINKCMYNSCKTDEDCNENEQCQLFDGGVHRCKCKRGYIEDTTGRCLHSGGEKQAKSHTVSPRSQPLAATTPSSQKKIPDPGPPLYIVSIAGSAVGVVIVIVGLTICLCYRNSINEKSKRMNSFDQEMNIVDRTHQLLAVNSSDGKDGVLGTRSLYRPYMEDLGFVEHLPTEATTSNEACTTNSVVSTNGFSHPPRYCVDVTTGEPFYSTIKKSHVKPSSRGIINHGLQDKPSTRGIVNHGLQDKPSTRGIVNHGLQDEPITVEENINVTKKNTRRETRPSGMKITTTTQNNTYDPKRRYTLNHDNDDNKKTNEQYFLSLLEKSKETENELENASRKSSASADTLSIPDYGDSSDSGDESEDANNNHFFIPGDDEEDLIGDLNEIHNDMIKISTRVIGQGAFGVVKHGSLHSIKGTKDVAIKMLKERSGLEISKEDRIKFYQEAVIVSQFDHHNIVALFGIIVSKTPCMILEYMSRGNLSKYLGKVCRIRKREGITDVSREMQCVFLKMARDIVEGMCHLASLKFIHRDLAARNILLAEHDGDLICKISDFGLSRHFIKDSEYYTSRGGNIPIRWTAPEALTWRKYSTQSDVWSYAIVLWEIWSFGTQPYEKWSNEKVIREVCEKGYRLPPPEAIPSVLHRIMVDCWNEDRSCRPTFPKLRFCLNYEDDRLLGKEDSSISDSNHSNSNEENVNTKHERGYRNENYPVTSENVELPSSGNVDQHLSAVKNM